MEKAMAPHSSTLAWRIPWMEKHVGSLDWEDPLEEELATQYSTLAWKIPWTETELLPFHFSLSCIGEGNGNPLQCSCLENPRDGGVWWAAVYGIAQSWT